MKARRVDLLIILLFAVVSAVTLTIAWSTLGGVRANAAETDRRIRTLAWAVLAYANEYGAFPQSSEELAAVGAGADSITRTSAANAWPTRRTDALRGEDPTSLDDGFHSILVVYGDFRSIPPYLKPDGLPTKVGTVPEVNGWLDAFGKALGAD